MAEYVTSSTDSGQKAEESLQFSDPQLSDKLEGFWSASKKLQKKRKDWCEDNKKMYKGEHWTERRPKYRESIVLNLEFMAVETIVPLMTDRQPSPVVIPANNKPASEEQAKKVEMSLQYHWRRLRMPLMSEQIIRHMLLYRDAIIQPFWNPNTGLYGDLDVELIHPDNFFVDPNATSLDDALYAIKAIPRSFKYIMQKWPDKAEEIKLEGAGEELDESDETKEHSQQYLVREFWFWTKGDDEQYKIAKVCKVGNIIVSQSDNPFYDYEGETQQVTDQLTGGQKDEQRYYNHFDYPKLPFILFSTFNIGNELYSTTSLIEQTAELNRMINKRKSQIQENANLMADSIWIIDEDSGVDEDLLVNRPGLIVKKQQGTEVRRESGVPLPGQVFEDLSHSQSTFDNIFGSHDITRGETGSGRTATESTILRQSDQGRVALLIRHFEAGLAELFNWWVHLEKVNYTEAHGIKIFGKEGALEYAELIRTDIEDGIEVIVKVGSTAPVDKLAQRNEYIDLALKGLLDPITLYDKMGDFDNVMEMVERLDLWKRGELVTGPQQPPPEAMPPEGEMPPEGPQVPPEAQVPANMVGAPTEKIPADVQEAREEHAMMMQGQIVPPNDNPTQAHMQEHVRLIKAEKEPPTELVQAVEQHVKQEFESYQQQPNQPQQPVV